MAELRFSSKLTAAQFSRARLGLLLSEDEGTRCRLFADGRSEFSRWKWSGTEEGEDGLVRYAGPQAQGAWLSEALDRNLAKEMCLVLQAAIGRGEDLSQIGAAGIFVSEGADSTDFYFLPKKTYLASSRLSGGEEFARGQGFFVSPYIDEPVRAMRFSQGVFAYYALTESLPFFRTDESERNADISDGFYIRPEHMVEGLEPEAAGFINSRLGSATNSENPGSQEDSSQNIQDIIEEIERSSIRAGGGPLPRYKSRYRRLGAKIRAARFLRRNKTQLGWGAAFAAVMLSILVPWGMNFMRQPSARGLEARQVVQAFYSAFARRDVPAVRAMTAGQARDDWLVLTSGYYVAARSREAMDEKAFTMTQAEYLALDPKAREGNDIWIFDIIGLKIDGIPAGKEPAVPRICDFAQPAADLGENSPKTFVAEYEFLRSEGEGLLISGLHRDTLTLERKGKKWQITHISAAETFLDMRQLSPEAAE